MTGTSTVSDPQILCKPCNRKMSRLEWMRNKVCDNPDCQCPEVKKAMKQAQEVITKARRLPNRIEIQEVYSPNEFDNGKDVEQMCRKVPPVMVIDILKGKKDE